VQTIERVLGATDEVPWMDLIDPVTRLLSMVCREGAASLLVNPLHTYGPRESSWMIEWTWSQLIKWYILTTSGNSTGISDHYRNMRNNRLVNQERGIYPPSEELFLDGICKIRVEQK